VSGATCQRRVIDDTLARSVTFGGATADVGKQNYAYLAGLSDNRRDQRYVVPARLFRSQNGRLGRKRKPFLQILFQAKKFSSGAA
jgi:hypothetical protein